MKKNMEIITEISKDSLESGVRDIGKILADKRKSRNLSLETVRDDTHITLRYLRAIEEGNLSQFPAEVYFTGTVRRYSIYLGVDGNELIERYTRLKQEQKKGEVSAPRERRSQPPTLLLTAVVGLVILAGAVFAAVRFLAMRTTQETQQAATPEISTAPAVTSTAPVQQQTVPVPEPARPPAPVPAPVPAPAPAPAAPAPMQGDLRLRVTVNGTSWIRVIADNKPVFEGVLPPGSDREWAASDSFNLKIGYVPGISATLNGQPVDVTQGAQQDVNDLTLTKDDLPR